jgi:hypothetical protein
VQKLLTFWLTAFAAIGPAHGQQAAAAAQGNSPPQSMPSLYKSPFATYRGFREEPPAVWREVNDEVARVGGHVGVLKAGPTLEAPRTDDRAAPGASSTPRPGPGGHHGKH